MRMSVREVNFLASCLRFHLPYHPSLPTSSHLQWIPTLWASYMIWAQFFLVRISQKAPSWPALQPSYQLLCLLPILICSTISLTCKACLGWFDVTEILGESIVIHSVLELSTDLFSSFSHFSTTSLNRSTKSSKFFDLIQCCSGLSGKEIEGEKKGNWLVGTILAWWTKIKWNIHFIQTNEKRKRGEIEENLDDKMSISLNFDVPKVTVLVH